MNDSDFIDAATRLVASRHSAPGARLVDATALDYGPASLDEVYRIQQDVASLVGPVGAWKTSAETDTSTPLGAPIFAAEVNHSGYTVPVDTMHLVGIEAELGFRIGTDISPTGRDFSEAQVANVIDAMIPLIELVDTRLTDYNAAGDFWKLADNQINFGMILGSPISAWQDVVAQSQPVALSVNGDTIKTSQGWDFPGTPLGLATRFINTFRNHCGGIKAGHVITTGSMTGIDFIEKGARVEANFDGLETVRVEIA